MEILKPNYNWAKPLVKRQLTTHGIIHHEGTTAAATPEQIHAYHLSLGWAGIAYNFYVRKNGKVYEGRPIDVVGGHTKNYSYCSVGICFEGNFEVEEMPEVQREAGEQLIDYIRGVYPNIIFGKHSAFNPTACPGKNFPFEDIVDGVETAEVSVEAFPQWKLDAFELAKKNGFITDDVWKTKLDDNTPVWAVFIMFNRLKEMMEHGKA